MTQEEKIRELEFWDAMSKAGGGNALIMKTHLKVLSRELNKDTIKPELSKWSIRRIFNKLINRK